MELGKAYVQVIPSTKGIQGQLTNELSGATTAASGKAGAGFGVGFGKAAIKSMGAIGLATSAGEVFTKGWSRMTSIDEAKAKLEALGHSVEEVQMISENANAAVTGTAYGMDAAMTAAASATAAGIEPGKELERYLGLIGDAAAVAGVDMNEMGSIFNKVAANGKVSTEEMNQLADRGIPIWQLLAKETGMSMDELRSAVSNGEIGIEEFQNAIETGMGGAAQTIGSSTIKGAISNIGASISRMGANFLGAADDGDSFAGRLLPLFNNLMGFMKTLEGGASVLGQVIGSILGPVMDGLGQVFNVIKSNAGSFEPIKNVLLQIGQIVGQVITAAIPIVVANIKSVMTVLKPLLSLIGKIISKLMPVISVALKIGTTVASVVSSVASKVSKLVSKVLSSLSFSGLVGKVKGIWNKVKNAIITPITTARDKIKGIINKIKGFFPLSAGKIFSGLKLPHFSVKGGKFPFGVGGKGSLPKWNVTWNRKAMDTPYVFSKATLFGAGEAGDEVLYGRSALLRDIQAAAGNGKNVTITNNISVDGAENPEQYAQRFARELRRQVRMGAV